MLSFSGSLKIRAGLEPCDVRKGYEELTAVVTQSFGLSATSGELFEFTNRSRTRLKILYWDGTGLAEKTNSPFRQTGVGLPCGA